MVRWIAGWLERFLRLGIDLALALIGGLLSAPLTAARRAATAGTVRPGTAAEVIDVRHRVLREGQPREAAVFDGDEAPTTRHWVAEHDGRVVGVVTVLAAPMPATDPAPGLPDGAAPAFQLRGMAILPEHRGQGLGDALLDAVHRDVGAPMWCNARIGAAGFYARRGWRAVGEAFEVPGIGPHRRMWWPGPPPG